MGGSRIEAAFDAGSIEAGDAKQPVHELELELQEGTPAPLYRLALALLSAAPLAAEVKCAPSAASSERRGIGTSSALRR
jgi:inorganic triphosphatase YgiF